VAIVNRPEAAGRWRPGARTQTANALSLKIPTADDLVILCRKGKAEEALQRLREIMGKLNDAQPPAQPHSGVVVGASR